jgi:hypothetical protein
MKVRAWQLLSICLLASLMAMLSTCANPTESVSPINSPSPGPTSSPGETSPVETPSPQVAALVEQARKDLSERLHIAFDQTRVLSVEAVQWRDSSLGCPMPGMNYLTVITPGYLIKLQAGDKTYEYHTSETQVVTCDKPQPPLSIGTESPL